MWSRRGPGSPADAWVGPLFDWPEVPKDALLQHARLRLQAHRPNDTQRLPLPLGAGDRSLLRPFTDIRVGAALQHGDDLTANRLAQGSASSPSLRMVVCEGLVSQRRYREASVILGGTCQELQATDREGCLALLEDVRRR